MSSYILERTLFHCGVLLLDFRITEVDLKRSKLEFLVLLYWFVGQNGDETVIKVLSAHKWPYIQGNLQTPLGTDPIAVDLQGKGHAWISGHSIGRYWPSYLSYDTGCSLDACAYRGSYDNKKYSFNCGNPTQRWYHVPRSFMQDGENTLFCLRSLVAIHLL
ncbi:hypothetical protein ACFX13_027299 [Malus domestica]